MRSPPTARLVRRSAPCPHLHPQYRRRHSDSGGSPFCCSACAPQLSGTDDVHADLAPSVMETIMKRVMQGLMLSLLISGSPQVRAEDIAPQARQNFAAIDALDVEHHWPAGVHVHWQSGEPDGKPESATGKHTHCSAFVAAAAKHLGIYILRPPEHAHTLLPNAQFDWLAGGEGASRGWRPLRDAAEAQAQANRGLFVIAAYKNRRDDKPGHIAIVRPGTKSP